MKVLFIGLGSAGQRHLQNLHVLKKNLIVSTTSDIKNRKLISLKKVLSKKKITEIYNIKYLKNSKEIKKFDPEVIFISNESHIHIKTLTPYLRQNKNVFVEKPLAINNYQLKSLYKNIRSSNSITAVGFQTRFNPCIIFLKKYLKKNKSKFVSSSFNWLTFLPNHRPWQNYNKSYAANIKLGGGVINSMSHELDLIYNLFGLPNSVSAFKNFSYLNIKADESVSALFNYDENHSVNLNLSFSSPQEKRNFIIQTNKELINCDLVKNSLLIYSYKNKKEQKYYFKLKRNDLFISELNNFLYCCDKKIESEISVKEGINSVRMALAMHRSIKTKKISYL